MKRSLIKVMLVTLGILAGLYILFALQDETTESVTETLSSDNSLERTVELNRHNKLLTIMANPNSELNDFTTDGCSGGLSVGWEYLATTVKDFNSIHGPKPAWEACCVEHDRSYHNAGGKTSSAEKSFEARRQADLTLKACVLKTGTKRRTELSECYNISKEELDTIYGGIANLMYGAVRIGGMPCTDLPWRWGYGWPECQ